MSKLGNAYSVSLVISTSVYPGLIAFTHHSTQHFLSTNTETSRSILVAGRSSKNKIWLRKCGAKYMSSSLDTWLLAMGNRKWFLNFYFYFIPISVRLWVKNPT